MYHIEQCSALVLHVYHYLEWDNSFRACIISRTDGPACIRPINIDRSHSFSGKVDIQSRLDNAMQDVNDKYALLEQAEKNAVRTALIEERGRFCLFISCLKPFVVS